MKIKTCADLHFLGGGSDKVYHCCVVDEGPLGIQCSSLMGGGGLY